MSDDANVLQALQSVAIDAFMRVEGNALVGQALDALSAAGVFSAAPMVQAKQSVGVEGFVAFEASVSAQQALQSLAVNGFKYDALGSGQCVQSGQSVSALAGVSVLLTATVNQAKQFVSVACVNGVFTALTASKVNDRARVLRRVGNRGSR